MKTAILLVLLAAPALAQPALRIELTGPPEPALLGARPGCDAQDIPDAPARAIRLADGEVQVYATHFDNRVAAGPDLRHVRHRCPVVLRGAGDDDPAAYDDRAWIVSPWTPDGRMIWAIVHNEFHGHRRPALCPTRRYMDCWFNALTAAVSDDGGRSFRRVPGRATVATLPYRFDQMPRGHHGYFNPTNIVTHGGAQFMMAFTTEALAQRPGNCLLRTTAIDRPDAWRAWDGAAFRVAFVDPYAGPGTRPVDPAAHVCTPVGAGRLRWPVTGLLRHAPTGQFIAVMQDGARGGGIHYATSPDLLDWSSPALLLPAVGHGAWACGDAPPLAYPALLDPDSPDRNFETAGPTALLFAVQFDVKECRVGPSRELLRWGIRIVASRL